MDRIVVRIESNKSAKPTISLLTIPPIAIAIVATTSGSNIHYLLLLADYVIIFLIIVWIVWRVTITNKRQQLKEAEVKVTPRGVQLLSIYTTQGKVGNVSKIRSFIPTRQIIDVIVTEVVWPHCVWSQVAFRVVKDTSNSQTLSNVAKDQTERECDDIKQIMEKKQPAHDIHELLQHDRVTIMPCFPEEYRGCLTYMTCLDIQVAIEEMLCLSQRKF